MTLPVVNSRVDLSLLHPRFKARLESFFDDPRIKGRVSIVSGCRSYAQQKYFYDKYKSGRGNLAANPDRRFGKNNFWRGSWHMQQEDGHCYAVDFRIVGKGISTWEVNNIAKSYGMHPTVASEWWHHQPRNGSGWFDVEAISEPKEAKVEPKMDWAGLIRFIEDLKNQVKVSPIRYKERSERVKVLQRRLGAIGFDAGVPDGIFGRGTRKAVKSFQRVSKLNADGIVGPATWEILWQ
jgi:hypothetical protein